MLQFFIWYALGLSVTDFGLNGISRTLHTSEVSKRTGFCVISQCIDTCVAALLKQRQLPPFRVKSLSVTKLANMTYRLEIQPKECHQPDMFSVWNTKVHSHNISSN